MSPCKRGVQANPRRAAVLLIVLATLTILAMLGTVFIHMQSTNRRIASNFTDEVRAKMMAQSGLEAAVEELRKGLGEPAGPGAASQAMIYYGSQTNETLAAIPNTPIESAANPSFAIEVDGNPSNGAAAAAPKTLLINSATRGISGAMATGRYGLNADVYTLKVFDTSGQIHLNEGLGHPYQSEVLKRILNRLGEDVAIGIPTLGDTIVAARPVTGYKTKGEVTALFTAAQAATFIDMVTCNAWEDAQVANPVPLSNDAAAAYFIPTVAAGPTPPMFLSRPTVSTATLTRFGRNRRHDNALNMSITKFYGSASGESTLLAQASVYGLDELNPRYIEITKRAPVNVNTAPRPVLTALLRDLEGFFIVEQKRPVFSQDTSVVWSNYNWAVWQPFMYYDYNSGITSLPAQRHTCGELGLLFRTTPISAAMAGAVADALITRRGTKSFEGWQDFSMFIDSLVGSTIVDPRPATSFAIYPGSVASTYYPTHAAQAMADVIKANANPNLHLNELNPDLALNLQVDKTDLIQASTEFCFHPTGTYEIESFGQVLIPTGTQDAFTAAGNEVAGQATARAIVRLFNLYRETHQKDFYAGTISANTAASPTYGNKALQIGPEVDNGAGPSETEYEGYVMLSTYGGSLALGSSHSPGTLQATPASSTGTAEGQSAVVHAHFDLDYRLHAMTAPGIAGGATHESLTVAGPWPSLTPTRWNNKDRTEDAYAWESPYCAANDASRYRMARTYSWTGSSLAVSLTAPPDLRIDGAYSEKSAAPMYWSLNGNLFPCKGTAAYWVKPSFELEFMGKPRILFNVDQGGMQMGNGMRTLMHVFNPGYEGGLEDYTSALPSGYHNMRPVTMAFGLTANTSLSGNPLPSPQGITPGRVSLLATHFNHTHAAPVVAKTRQIAVRHQWMHTVVSWDIGTTDPMLPTTWAGTSVRLYVNGRDPSENTSQRNLSASWSGGTAGEPDNQYYYDMRSPRQMVPIRLGGQPHYYGSGRTAQARNYPADSTIDEFYLWNLSHNDLTTWNKAIGLYQLGRYYRENDGTFTSKSITLPTSSGRIIPPATLLAPPVPTGEGGGGGEGLPITPPAGGAGSQRLLGMTWTVYGILPSGLAVPAIPSTTECSLRAFRYQIHNYQPNFTSSLDPTIVTPVLNAQVSMDNGTTWLAAMTGPAWGSIQQTVSGPLKYRVTFNSGADPLNGILVASPVLDDVTFYYEDFAYLQLSMNA